MSHIEEMRTMEERKKMIKRYICDWYDKCSKAKHCDHAKPHKPDRDPNAWYEDKCLETPCPCDEAPDNTKCRKLKQGETKILSY